MAVIEGHALASLEDEAPPRRGARYCVRRMTRIFGGSPTGGASFILRSIFLNRLDRLLLLLTFLERSSTEEAYSGTLFVISGRQFFIWLRPSGCFLSRPIVHESYHRLRPHSTFLPARVTVADWVGGVAHLICTPTRSPHKSFWGGRWSMSLRSGGMEGREADVMEEGAPVGEG